MHNLTREKKNKKKTNMKNYTPKKKVTICLDEIQHEIIKKRLEKQRRSLSAELNKIILVMNQNNMTTDQLIRV